MPVQCEFWVISFGTTFMSINRSEETSRKCTDPVFWGNSPYDDALAFVFKCRAEEWLQAEGLVRKRRRQRGEQELVEDLEVGPLPKPEPVEETIRA